MTAGSTSPVPLTQFVDRPGIIDLAWGHPDPDLLPVSALADAAGRALRDHGPDALGYGSSAGPAPLLDWLRVRLAEVDARPPGPGELVATAGNSWAIDQVATLLARPGDAVLVESPTYHLAVRILRDHPLDLVPVAFDEAGLRVDDAADAIARVRRRGGLVSLLYTVPTFHNPTGMSLAPERRRALVELAAAEGVVVVEDDAYRELAYDGVPPASLWSAAPPGTVVRLGSFAKSLAPGLRTGFLSADEPTIARFVEGGVLDSGGGISHFASLVVAAYAATGEYAANVERLRAAYRERRDALLEALAEEMPPGTAWTHPAGGYFVWVTLPEDRDARALRVAAEAEGMSYVPGDAFELRPGMGSASLRLAFSRYPPDRLREAARRLGRAVRRAPGQAPPALR